MSKKFKSYIFLMLGVLIFIIVLAGCEQLPVVGNNIRVLKNFSAPFSMPLANRCQL